MNLRDLNGKVEFFMQVEFVIMMHIYTNSQKLRGKSDNSDFIVGADERCDMRD